MSGTRKSQGLGRGYFGVVIWQPKQQVNVGSLWRSAWLYDAAFVATVGRRYSYQPSDTPHTADHVPLFHYDDAADLRRHLPKDCPLIGVELDPEAKSLPDFWHPPRAVYMLGAEDKGLPQEALSICHQLVQIPAVRDFSMNVAVAGSIVMYDRWAKRA